eukprot:TRINITY_DN6132_c0_g1_i1.p1 TRINITY_DN6132_c0_g1~~TRINITY_DN6132_c0_g1_i1.p1  ORF type:complete len:2047 (+),score=280.93 TRINITY_DN6132_c0_g1_i1:34-6174(+)
MTADTLQAKLESLLGSLHLAVRSDDLPVNQSTFNDVSPSESSEGSLPKRDGGDSGESSDSSGGLDDWMVGSPFLQKLRKLNSQLDNATIRQAHVPFTVRLEKRHQQLASTQKTKSSLAKLLGKVLSVSGESAEELSRRSTVQLPGPILSAAFDLLVSDEDTETASGPIPQPTEQQGHPALKEPPPASISLTAAVYQGDISSEAIDLMPPHKINHWMWKEVYRVAHSKLHTNEQEPKEVFHRVARLAKWNAWLQKKDEHINYLRRREEALLEKYQIKIRKLTITLQEMTAKAAQEVPKARVNESATYESVIESHKKYIFGLESALGHYQKKAEELERKLRDKEVLGPNLTMDDVVRSDWIQSSCIEVLVAHLHEYEDQLAANGILFDPLDYETVLQQVELKIRRRALNPNPAARPVSPLSTQTVEAQTGTVISADKETQFQAEPVGAPQHHGSKWQAYRSVRRSDPLVAAVNNVMQPILAKRLSTISNLSNAKQTSAPVTPRLPPSRDDWPETDSSDTDEAVLWKDDPPQVMEVKRMYQQLPTFHPPDEAEMKLLCPEPRPSTPLHRKHPRNRVPGEREREPALLFSRGSRPSIVNELTHMGLLEVKIPDVAPDFWGVKPKPEPAPPARAPTQSERDKLAFFNVALRVSHIKNILVAARKKQQEVRAKEGNLTQVLHATAGVGSTQEFVHQFVAQMQRQLQRLRRGSIEDALAAAEQALPALVPTAPLQAEMEELRELYLAFCRAAPIRSRAMSVRKPERNLDNLTRKTFSISMKETVKFDSEIGRFGLESGKRSRTSISGEGRRSSVGGSPPSTSRRASVIDDGRGSPSDLQRASNEGGGSGSRVQIEPEPQDLQELAEYRAGLQSAQRLRSALKRQISMLNVPVAKTSRRKRPHSKGSPRTPKGPSNYLLIEVVEDEEIFRSKIMMDYGSGLQHLIFGAFQSVLRGDRVSSPTTIRAKEERRKLELELADAIRAKEAVLLKLQTDGKPSKTAKSRKHSTIRNRPNSRKASEVQLSVQIGNALGELETMNRAALISEEQGALLDTVAEQLYAMNKLASALQLREQSIIEVIPQEVESVQGNNDQEASDAPDGSRRNSEAPAPTETLQEVRQQRNYIERLASALRLVQRKLVQPATAASDPASPRSPLRTLTEEADEADEEVQSPPPALVIEPVTPPTAEPPPSTENEVPPYEAPQPECVQQQTTEEIIINESQPVDEARGQRENTAIKILNEYEALHRECIDGEEYAYRNDLLGLFVFAPSSRPPSGDSEAVQHVEESGTSPVENVEPFENTAALIGDLVPFANPETENEEDYTDPFEQIEPVPGESKKPRRSSSRSPKDQEIAIFTGKETLQRAMLLVEEMSLRLKFTSNMLRLLSHRIRADARGVLLQERKLERGFTRLRDEQETTFGELRKQLRKISTSLPGLAPLALKRRKSRRSSKQPVIKESSFPEDDEEERTPESLPQPVPTVSPVAESQEPVKVLPEAEASEASSDSEPPRVRKVATSDAEVQTEKIVRQRQKPRQPSYTRPNVQVVVKRKRAPATPKTPTSQSLSVPALNITDSESDAEEDSPTEESPLGASPTFPVVASPVERAPSTVMLPQNWPREESAQQLRMRAVSFQPPASTPVLTAARADSLPAKPRGLSPVHLELTTPEPVLRVSRQQEALQERASIVSTTTEPPVPKPPSTAPRKGARQFHMPSISAEPSQRAGKYRNEAPRPIRKFQPRPPAEPRMSFTIAPVAEPNEVVAEARLRAELGIPANLVFPSELPRPPDTEKPAIVTRISIPPPPQLPSPKPLPQEIPELPESKPVPHLPPLTVRSLLVGKAESNFTDSAESGTGGSETSPDEAARPQDPYYLTRSARRIAAAALQQLKERNRLPERVSPERARAPETDSITGWLPGEISVPPSPRPPRHPHIQAGPSAPLHPLRRFETPPAIRENTPSTTSFLLEPSKHWASASAHPTSTSSSEGGNKCEGNPQRRKRRRRRKAKRRTGSPRHHFRVVPATCPLPTGDPLVRTLASRLELKPATKEDRKALLHVTTVYNN